MYRTTTAKLLATYRAARQNPSLRIGTGMWDQPTWTAAQFSRWFMRCLHAKINRDDTRQWRKLTPEYQLALAHDANLVNDHARRIRHSGANLLHTPELRRRYPHVNTPPWDE